jgi:NADH dehydrogenase
MIEAPAVHVVTGAFGYTGRYITARLLEAGESLRTLTGHPAGRTRSGIGSRVVPFDFDDRRKLTEHLRGTKTLYNTCWVRFPHGEVTFDRAVANSL